jgi:lysophospholipase L1-like esterase
MLAVRRTRLLRSMLAALLALGTALAVPAAAHADPSETGRSNATGWYLALGDSLAAGYQPDRTPAVDLDGGYVGAVLEAAREDSPKTKLVNLACPGATSTTMVAGGGQCEYEKRTQMAQARQFLRAHGQHTRLITLTVGANDITPCLREVNIAACAADVLQAYGPRLAGMVASLRAAAPHARIVVTNYYNPYLALFFSPDAQQRALVPLTTQLQQVLNATIAQATGSNGSVADVATEFSSYDGTLLPGTSIPRNVAVICDWTWMCARQDIHANDQGYAAIARAVAARL